MRRAAPVIGSWITCWALAGFLARAVVPAGFMLASSAQGWPIQACPGQTHGVLHLHATTHRDSQGDRSEDPCKTDCFQGVFFALAADLDTFDLSADLLAEVGRSEIVSELESADADAESARPRGPPAVGKASKA